MHNLINNIFFDKKIISIYFILLLHLNFCQAQYKNKWVVGLSNSGTYESNLKKGEERISRLYHEFLLHVGYETAKDFYLYLEGGRSFYKATDYYDDIPSNWFLGGFSRWYMAKHKFLDVYSGAGVMFSNFRTEDNIVYPTRYITNPEFSLYGGICFKIFKGLHLAIDYGYQYRPGLSNFFHRKVTLQYGF